MYVIKKAKRLHGVEQTTRSQSHQTMPRLLHTTKTLLC